jgi:hypothetical protein
MMSKFDRRSVQVGSVLTKCPFPIANLVGAKLAANMNAVSKRNFRVCLRHQAEYLTVRSQKSWPPPAQPFLISGTVGTQTSDLPSCSPAPPPSTLSCALGVKHPCQDKAVAPISRSFGQRIGDSTRSTSEPLRATARAACVLALSPTPPARDTSVQYDRR